MTSLARTASSEGLTCTPVTCKASVLGSSNGSSDLRAILPGNSPQLLPDSVVLQLGMSSEYKEKSNYLATCSQTTGAAN